MQPVSRRTFLVFRCSCRGGAVILRGRYRVFASTTQEYPERVVRLMEESLVVDMLNQFLYRFDQKDLKEKWLTEPGAFTQADFERFKSTGVQRHQLRRWCRQLCEARKNCLASGTALLLSIRNG